MIFLVLTMLLGAKPVWAFDTPGHDEITQKIADACGFDPTGYQLLNQGNRYADYWDPNDHGGEGQVPAAHVDAESFLAASIRIKGLLQKTTCALLDCDRAAALEALGRAMHPVEDFFSHSNIVEIEEHDGRRYSVDFLNLPAPHPELVCDPATHLTNAAGLAGLTTGYFKAGDNNWKPAHKCSHYELNKDYPDPKPDESGSPALSKRLRPLAIARAVEEGTKFLRDVAEPKIEATIRRAFQPIAAAQVSSSDETCTVEMPAPTAANALARVTAGQLLEYLRSGGDCPVQSAPKCPNIKW